MGWILLSLHPTLTSGNYKFPEIIYLSDAVDLRGTGVDGGCFGCVIRGTSSPVFGPSMLGRRSQPQSCQSRRDCVYRGGVRAVGASDCDALNCVAAVAFNSARQQCHFGVAVAVGVLVLKGGCGSLGAAVTLWGRPPALYTFDVDGDRCVICSSRSTLPVAPCSLWIRCPL